MPRFKISRKKRKSPRFLPVWYRCSLGGRRSRQGCRDARPGMKMMLMLMLMIRP